MRKGGEKSGQLSVQNELFYFYVFLLGFYYSFLSVPMAQPKSRILLCLLPHRIQNPIMSLLMFDVSESQCRSDSQTTSSVFPVSVCCFCSYYQCVGMSGFLKGRESILSSPLVVWHKGREPVML